MDKNYIQFINEILSRVPMTQKELADELGVTFAALNRWVNGHAAPHPKRIEAIKKLHRLKVGYPSITAYEIQGLIQKACRFRRKHIRKLFGRHQSLAEELVLEHTYNSTTIEGNTMTKREAEAVIFSKKVIRDRTLVEHLEMTNHASVFRHVLSGEYRGPVTEDLIKSIHRDLMNGIREDAGHYSKYQRVIRGLDIALTHPEDISEEMNSLVRAWNRKWDVTIKDIADFHSSFELIHPFGDGNGRVGRLVMTIQCLEAGYLPLVIENERKLEYYDVLEYAQRKADGPFIAFLADELGRTDKIFRKYKL